MVKQVQREEHEIDLAPTLIDEPIGDDRRYLDEKSYPNEKGSDSLDSPLDKEAEYLASIPPLGAPPAEGGRQTGILQYLGYHSTTNGLDLDAIATQPSVFDQAEVPKVYIPAPKYEGAHRFDPLCRWTWREEVRLVRKIDMRIMIWAGFMFFAMQIDRGNISQANSADFLQHIGLTTDDFNLGQTVNHITFLLAELPSQLISKRLGPDRWIPTQMCLWSIVAGAQFWLNGRSSFLACRALLGLLQGGFIPDVVLYLSYYYNTSELSFRLAWFWAAESAAVIAASFLAYGILRVNAAGHAGWQWLFLIEALITFAFGFGSYFMLPASPTETKAWFRPKGYFTDREEYIMVNRILRDDPSKSDMHNRQGISLKNILKSLGDYDLWPIYAIALLFQCPLSPPTTYFNISLRHLHFQTLEINLLNIPVTVLGIITMLLITWSSFHFNDRAFHGIICQLWCIPFLVLEYLHADTLSPWSQYAIIGLLTAQPFLHAVQIGWTSQISHSVRTRTVSAATYNTIVQLGNIISANIALTTPLFVSLRPELWAFGQLTISDRRGNKVLIAITCINIGLYSFAKVYYTWRTKTRRAQWEAMSQEEQRVYLATTTDEGNKRKDFYDFVS